MPQKQIIPQNLKINDTKIEFVDNFVFLGVTLNKHLNWSNHIDKTANKIAKSIGMINSLKKALPLNIIIKNNIQLLDSTTPKVWHISMGSQNQKTRYHTKNGGTNTSSQ